MNPSYLDLALIIKNSWIILFYLYFQYYFKANSRCYIISFVNISVYTMILDGILPNPYFISAMICLAEITYLNYNILIILHQTSALANIIVT